MISRRDFSVAAGLMLFLPAEAQAGRSSAPSPKKSRFAAAPPRPKSSIVIDADVWRVLDQTNAEQSLDPASLTKLMTMYVAYDQKLDLDKPLPVSYAAARQDGSRVGLRVGQTITGNDAMRAMVGPSANDAAVALAEGVAGTEANFVKLMNQAAVKLGMTHTVFANATGLEDSRQKTRVEDMAKLINALRIDFPEHYGVFRDPVFFDPKGWEFNGKTFFSHNSILHGVNPSAWKKREPGANIYEGADGGKTGYFSKIGCNMVQTAVRGGRRLIVVVIGEDSGLARDLKVRQLFDQGFATPAPARPLTTPLSENIQAVRLDPPSK